MAKGRKSIPSKILELRGGTAHSHKPARDKEPTPPVKKIRAPSWLNKAAQREWRRVQPLLFKVGLMSELEVAHLGAYCQSFADYVAAVIFLQEKGTVYQKENKEPAQNPYWRIAREAYDMWSKSATILGIGSANRVGMKSENPNPKTKDEEFTSRKAWEK